MEDLENIEKEEFIMRLNKYLAHCGIGTRKETVEIIKKGRVTVNDTVVKEPFYEVKPTDVIRFNDSIIVPKKSYSYILFNKGPKSTVSPLEGFQRPSVEDLVQKYTGHKLSAALSLDDMHCGLMVLSDDPNFIEKMAGKGMQLVCTYDVHCLGELPEKLVDTIKRNEVVKISSLEVIPAEGTYKLSLDARGANDGVLARMLIEAGCVIERLDRMKIGSLTKKDLKRGWSRALTEKELIFLSYFG